MPAGALHRHHATNAQPRHAAFQAAHRLQGAVGGHHGAAERRQVVAVLLRHMHTQPRNGRRRVELELLHAVVTRQGLETGHEQIGHGLALAAVELVLHQRNAGHQCTQGLGAAAFGGNRVVDGLEVRIQRAALGVMHQAVHVRQVGKRQRRPHTTNGDTHDHHDLGPETEFVKHRRHLEEQRANGNSPGLGRAAPAPDAAPGKSTFSGGQDRAPGLDAGTLREILPPSRLVPSMPHSRPYVVFHMGRAGPAAV